MTSLSPPRTADGISSSTDASASASGSTKPLITTSRDDIPRLRPPRSLPPWITPYDERFGAVSKEQLRLVRPPPPSVQPQHNSTPFEIQRRRSKDGYVVEDDPKLGPPKPADRGFLHFLRYGRASQRGRQWDHLRSAEPVIVPAFMPSYVQPQPPTSWHDFIQSSAWGPTSNEKSEVVSPEVLNQLQPTFGNPSRLPPHPPDPVKNWLRRFNQFIMRNPISPLLFRLCVMITSILALGVSARLYVLENERAQDSAERTQSLVAVAVDCVAIPFIAYTIWDEYTGKPLGLRPAVSKISLILLDLFFIIFKSASTALAFETVVYHSLGYFEVRRLTKTLASLMLIGLLSWTLNLTVNIFRVVDKLGGGEDDGHIV